MLIPGQGPREISVNHVDAVRDIHGSGTICVKGPFYDLNHPPGPSKVYGTRPFIRKEGGCGTADLA